MGDRIRQEYCDGEDECDCAEGHDHQPVSLHGEGPGNRAHQHDGHERGPRFREQQHAQPEDEQPREQHAVPAAHAQRGGRCDHETRGFDAMQVGVGEAHKAVVGRERLQIPAGECTADAKHQRRRAGEDGEIEQFTQRPRLRERVCREREDEENHRPFGSEDGIVCPHHAHARETRVRDEQQEQEATAAWRCESARRRSEQPKHRSRDLPHPGRRDDARRNVGLRPRNGGLMSSPTCRTQRQCGEAGEQDDRRLSRACPFLDPGSGRRRGRPHGGIIAGRSRGMQRVRSHEREEQHQNRIGKPRARRVRRPARVRGRWFEHERRSGAGRVIDRPFSASHRRPP